jgi:hypothetical protein
VHGEVPAAVPGDAGGDVDQVGPDRDAACPGMAGGGEGAGGAGQVVRDRCQGEPGGVGGEPAGGGVGERAAGEVGEDLLDLGVVAVRSSACSMVNGESVSTAW